jgi:hypothetical protein
MDEPDKTALASLDDGVEVTILGWRPGWSGMARYSVRAVISGLEGWLPAASLRGTEAFVPAAPDASAVADTVTVDSGRRFGETAHRR